jgi:tRNA threonylcarbamoyladenosine biosynthesis protein TsaB
MIALALDTATPQVGVALAGPDGPLASLQVREGRRHGEVLAPAIETVCRLAGVTLAAVDVLAVDVGPGLFTGLRVGISTAKALADGLDTPAIGLTSTAILAAAHVDAGRPVVAVVDIRRGEVAWALYEPVDGAMVELSPPARAAADELGRLAKDLPAGVLAVGDGARRYAGDLGLEVAGPIADHPSAAVLAGLGLDRAGTAGDASGLVPCYLREADVRIGWAQAPARD